MRTRIIVLVVGVVLVLLGGLVVVGIQYTQAEAARTQCRLNLCMIGLAAQNRASTYNDYLPQATVELSDAPDKGNGANLPPERRLSWIVEIAPYLEQGRVLVDRSKAWDDEINVDPKLFLAAAHHPSNPNDSDEYIPLRPWKTLCCPANPAVAEPNRTGLTHYVGVAGVGSDAISRPNGDPRNGVFGYNRRISYRTNFTKKGISTTLLAIETTDRNGPWTAPGFPTVRSLNRADGPYLGAGGQFGSNHPSNGIPFLSTRTQAVMCDGSVRSLQTSMSPEVLEALASFAGEVALPTDW
jgi:Protein of unknown function (DUF1559)